MEKETERRRRINIEDVPPEPELKVTGWLYYNRQMVEFLCSIKTDAERRIYCIKRGHSEKKTEEYLRQVRELIKNNGHE